MLCVKCKCYVLSFQPFYVFPNQQFSNVFRCFTEIDVTLLNGANEVAAAISRRTGGHFDLFEAVEDCVLWVED